VIESSKAQLKATAFKLACTLLKEEYRKKLIPKYGKTIKQIARRPVKEEKREASLNCPYCSDPVPVTQMKCETCKNYIPFCIASGYHITLENCTFCPSCDFPADAIMFRRILEIDSKCPMCNAELSAHDIKVSSKVLEKLKKR